MFERKTYIGDKVIDDDGMLKSGVNLENGYVVVSFTDGSKEVFGKEILEILKSDKPIDASALRDKKITFIASKILELLLTHNVKPSEFEFLTAVLQGSMNENIRKANDKLWGKPALERTMLDLDRILKGGDN